MKKYNHNLDQIFALLIYYLFLSYIDIDDLYYIFKA